MQSRKQLFNGLVRSKSGLGLINWFLSTYRLIWAKAPTKKRVSVLRTFARSVYLLSKKNRSKNRLNGVVIPDSYSETFLIKYLKTASVMLQQYAAKNKERCSSRDIGAIAVSATRAGLPRIIPSSERVKIRKGCRLTISFWLSLLNMYRILQCAYKYEGMYNTIWKPGTGWVLTEECIHYISLFWSHLDKRVKNTDPVLPEFKPYLTTKSSTHSRPATSILGFIRFVHSFRLTMWRYKDGLEQAVLQAKLEFKSLPSELRAKKVYKTLYSSQVVTSTYTWLKAYRSLLKANVPAFLPMIDSFDEKKTPYSLVRFVSDLKSPSAAIMRWYKTWKLPNFRFNFLKHYIRVTCSEVYGKLKALEEPAGKLRIIAIVDPLTQYVLRPLDTWVSNIVRQLPQDGKYDQEAPLVRLWNTVKSKGIKFVGSVDMSAATDRLPVALQEAILAYKFGPKYAKDWRDILVGRYYYVMGQGDIKHMFKYAVGQPMGALSSWTMLDLTHHFMWQWAAWRSREVPESSWFEDYSVLGDDSNSVNQHIVEEYMKICAELGVGINKFKSLFSQNGSFEFAKRFWNWQGDCSPVSLKELLVSSINVGVLSNWPRKRGIRIADLLSIVGYRHKTVSRMNGAFHKLPKKCQNLLVMITSPWGSYPAKSFFDWISLNGLCSKRVVDHRKVIAIILDLLDIQDKKLFKRLLTNGRPGFSRSPVPLEQFDQDRLAEMYQYYIPEKEYDNALKDPDNMKKLSRFTYFNWFSLSWEVLSRSQYVSKERSAFFDSIINGLDTTLVASDLVYEPLREQVIFKLSDLSAKIYDLRECLQSPMALNDEMVNHFFAQYVEIADGLDLIHPHIYSISEQEIFRGPNQMNWVRMWRRFHQCTV